MNETQDKIYFFNFHLLNQAVVFVWIYENGVKELDPKPWFQWTFTPSLGPVNGQKVEKGRKWKEDKRVE